MKKLFFCFKQISKCNTCFYVHFSRAFLKYSFQICSFIRKKVMGYFRFFYTDRTFYRPVPYSMHKKMFLSKNHLNFHSLKVTTFHSDSVKDESARTKNTGRGLSNAPPPYRLAFKKSMFLLFYFKRVRICFTYFF